MSKFPLALAKCGYQASSDGSCFFFSLRPDLKKSPVVLFPGWFARILRGVFAALCRPSISSQDAFLNENMATLQQINSSCGFMFPFAIPLVWWLIERISIEEYLVNLSLGETVGHIDLISNLAPAIQQN
jgi:hypothetical protein